MGNSLVLNILMKCVNIIFHHVFYSSHWLWDNFEMYWNFFIPGHSFFVSSLQTFPWGVGEMHLFSYFCHDYQLFSHHFKIWLYSQPRWLSPLQPSSLLSSQSDAENIWNTQNRRCQSWDRLHWTCELQGHFSVTFFESLFYGLSW